MKDLMIALQSGKTSLYEQIYLSIKRDIEDGKISFGEKLPSTRLLAANLNVSRFTVDLAYSQLVSEGYIQSRAGSGFFVCDLSNLYSGISGAKTSAEGEATGKAQKEAPPCSVRIDFSPFAVDSAQFPYNTWKKRNREVFDEITDILVAREAAGDHSLRETIANYLYHARGVHCTPEQILVGAGNEYLLLLLVQILGGGRSVVMENPTYLQAYHVLCRAGCQVRVGEMDEDGLCCGSLDRGPVDVVYVMPSHQFPVGAVMPFSRRQELLDWAKAAEGRYIIEDDHDSEFRYVGKPIPSLQSGDQDDRVIYFGTFSKSISPALRMSYMVLPRHLSERFYEQFDFYSSTVPTQQQLAVCRFMQSGDFERHLNRMRRVYKAKHDFLLKELKQRPWVKKVRGENAGLHLVVEVSCACTEEELLEAALQKGVRVYGMNSYRIGPVEQTEPVTLLLGFGGLSEKELSEGLAVLDGLLDAGS
ncbi:MAG: PLP-dependent aminotransferase family protein [bacterium]|nr:PLP-dependent aminotransferase family protein [bacterium]MDY4099703.1 PLP-dependent aminotransferase family protein [Lachnospiraceae bacterium]